MLNSFAPKAPDDVLADEQSIEENNTNSVNNGTRMNRASAINQLLIISDYFAANEPTSPIPYLLKRAAKWANLSFSEVLQELIEDQPTLEKAYKLSGIEESDS